MNVRIILPFFGKFHNYFDLWLSSAAYNNSFSFLLLTDSATSLSSIPPNVTVVEMSFADVQKRIHERIGKYCSITTPYKLCDYKPMYGIIFSDFLDGYDWWGNCDPDIVWGDLSRFITNELLEKYEKIYTLGHLTLYRNNAKVNYTYKKVISMPYTAFEATHTSKNVAFDEIGCKLLSDHGLYHTFDDRNAFLDIFPAKFRFRSFVAEENQTPFIAEFQNGHIWGHFVNKDTVFKREFAYIHLQKRNMDIKNTDLEHFLIVPNMFLNYDPKLLTPSAIIDINSKPDRNYIPQPSPKTFSGLDLLIELKRTLRRIYNKLTSR